MKQNDAIEPSLPPVSPSTPSPQAFENFGADTRPVRRVGTVTLGVTLIAVGVLLLVTLVSGNYSLLWLGRLSPAILILIGLEIVLSFAFSRQRPIKYDFLSVFICLFLIFGSIVGALIPTAISLAQDQSRVQMKVRQEAEATVDSILKSFSSIKESWISVYSASYDFLDFPSSNEEWKTEQYFDLSLEVTLKSQFDTSETFSKEADQILKAVADITPPYQSISIRSEKEGSSYYFQTDGNYAGNWTAEEIEAEITPDE